LGPSSAALPSGSGRNAHAQIRVRAMRMNYGADLQRFSREVWRAVWCFRHANVREPAGFQQRSRKIAVVPSRCLQ
jgi:hypothetical protein